MPSQYTRLISLLVPSDGLSVYRDALLRWYSLLLLRDYRRIFGSTSEAGQLDNISRRFAWFRRILKSHEDENGSLFPSSWNVGAVLAGSFSEVTKLVLPSIRNFDFNSRSLATGTISRVSCPNLRQRSTSTCYWNRSHKPRNSNAKWDESTRCR